MINKWFNVPREWGAQGLRRDHPHTKGRFDLLEGNRVSKVRELETTPIQTVALDHLSTILESYIRWILDHWLWVIFTIDSALIFVFVKRTKVKSVTLNLRRREFNFFYQCM